MNHQPYQLNPVILFFDFVLVRTGKMQVQNPQAPSLYHNPSLPKTAGKPKTIPKNIPKSSCLDDDFLLYVLAWCQRCLLFPSVFLKKKHINPYTVTIPQVNPSKQVMVLLGKNLLWQTSGGKKPSCQKFAPGATWLKIAWPQIQPVVTMVTGESGDELIPILEIP